MLGMRTGRYNPASSHVCGPADGGVRWRVPGRGPAAGCGPSHEEVSLGHRKRILETIEEKKNRGKTAKARRAVQARREGNVEVHVWACREVCVIAGYHIWRRGLAVVSPCPREVWETITPEEREVVIMAIVRKVAAAGADGGPPPAPKVSQLGRETAELWEYMTARTYEDGSKRETASLTLFWGAQGLTAVLNDRDNARALFASGPGLEEVLALLSEMAGSPETQWRNDRNQTGNSKRQK